MKFLLRTIVLSQAWTLMLSRPWIKKQGLIANIDTELVIEGFPRSGNTFTVVGIKELFPELNVAHHLHVGGQLKFATNRGIPAYLLIRSPADAVSSFVTREPHISLTEALLSYIVFHASLLPIKKKIFVLDFNQPNEKTNLIFEIASNLGNKKRNSPKNVQLDEQDIFARIVDINESSDNPGKHSIAIPQQIRTNSKRLATIDLHKGVNKILLYYAELLYQYFRRRPNDHE